jgi:hypothetical protein
MFMTTSGNTERTVSIPVQELDDGFAALYAEICDMKLLLEMLHKRLDAHGVLDAVTAAVGEAA